MTYATGNVIAASDYQNFRGSLAPSNPYASNAAATSKVAALVGTGFGTRGYGQTSSNLNAASTGILVQAADWNNLRLSMSNINVHTGSNLTVQNVVTIGSQIQAFDGTGGSANVQALINTLDTNRLNYSIGQMGLTSTLTSTRSTSWTVSIFHEFTVTFASEDQARYYFNSGGQIYLAGSRTGGTVSTVNTQLTNLLSAMGTVKIGAQATTYTGTGGTPTSIGYYGLIPVTYQTLFTESGANASYSVHARVENVIGSNGGNGSVVRVHAIFSTGFNSYTSADGTLTSSISELKTGGVLSLPSPAWATTISL